jgi:hypothetical protein
MIPLSTARLGIFQENKVSVFYFTEDGIPIIETVSKVKGSLARDQIIYLPSTSVPTVITEDSISIITQRDESSLDDLVFTSISDDIFKIFYKIQNKQNIKSHVYNKYVYYY